MAESKLAALSMDFAVKVLRLCDSIKGHYSLVSQLERSATSIGANIHEANYASSKADFINKFQIALKECYETEYWLDIFHTACILTDAEFTDMYGQCSKIRKLLVASITTAFCDGDDAGYGNLHPRLIWGRTKTIGRGDECCNFLLQYWFS